MRSIVEIFIDGQWVPAAEFTPNGRYKSTFEYLIGYVFAENPLPVSLSLPVSMARLGVDGESGAPDCPAFLLDLVPQGRGRKLLVQELGLNDSEDHDLLLAQYGAFNPVGNLRLDSAVGFYSDWQKRNPKTRKDGFYFADIITGKEEFLEHIWTHAMFAAGTTGIQGAAPKFLLTQNGEGLWFADAALPDVDAAKHWLVKLPRGAHETDYAVLRNEAAYLRVAARCGLRTGGEPMHAGDMLFVPRFDRSVRADGLHRHAQETLASLAGVRGFGMPVSMFALVESFRQYVTNPVQEIVEFIRRDVLNLAMKNTDNHARNTSVQRLPDGTVQLTPVYDFAPMYLDREMIIRGCRWRTPEKHDIADLAEIVETLCLSESEKREVTIGLRDFSGPLSRLSEIMQDCGVDQAVIEYCKPHIDAQFERLQGVK
ncbi:type II toxin-antitoxin system HipA family toxin [Propionivibrio sp.]|uniref:type II toxin-antitoxin system HipA family toxin n=1 Tax=Propionivibrio sp. TaxID=2212460 RepID=UPI003BF102FD